VQQETKHDRRHFPGSATIAIAAAKLVKDARLITIKVR
jgi:hypothetical protein